MRALRVLTSSDPISNFLSDIEPFFSEQTVIFAEVGAGDGSTFAAVLDIGLSVDRAVLIEADPKVFVLLQKAVAARNHEDRFTCLNLRMFDQQTVVRLPDRQDIIRAFPGTKDTSTATEADCSPGRHFEVEARRFDDLADLFPDGHVSILKIKVAGHETEVLRGCNSMLAAHAIEVLYIEAGVAADNPRQTYFRNIDDIVIAHGYRLFRIYEQTHAAAEDVPALRRFDMAYFSPAIAARYPMTVAHEMSRLRANLDSSDSNVATAHAEVESLAAALKERFEEIALLTRSFESVIAERDAALNEVLRNDLARGKRSRKDPNRRKRDLVIGAILAYSIALAAASAFILWYF